MEFNKLKAALVYLGFRHNTGTQFSYRVINDTGGEATFTIDVNGKTMAMIITELTRKTASSPSVFIVTDELPF